MPGCNRPGPPLLLRDRLRRVVGQVEPRFSMGELFTRRRIVLVNASAGRLGAEAARLLGSLALSQFWQATLARSALAEEQRHPAFVYLDEFQAYLGLPVDLADMLAQARSMGVGVVLAHQHLAQLSPAVRAAVLANARSRVVFQTASAITGAVGERRSR